MKKSALFSKGNTRTLILLLMRSVVSGILILTRAIPSIARQKSGWKFTLVIQSCFEFYLAPMPLKPRWCAVPNPKRAMWRQGSIPRCELDGLNGLAQKGRFEMTGKRTAISVFVGTIESCREMVEEITEAIDDHLGVPPDEEKVNWAHVGDAQRLAANLREILEWVHPLTHAVQPTCLGCGKAVDEGEEWCEDCAT
jgi:hypothetical protein